MQSVFTLIIAGELLALALVVAKHGLSPFNWEALGSVSFLVQWVVLLSAGLLCPLRPFLARHSLLLAGCITYSLILFVTLVVSVVGQWMVQATGFDGWQVASNLLLSAIFSGIVLRYFYIQQQLLRQEEAELHARIQALQSRIRPHFLFNSMNSIVSLIGSDPEMAERVVVDLSDLFRASLAEPGKVPLKRELMLCKQYMSIEQLRLGARLKLDWQVDANVEECLMPSLLLQPILENAIYHGIQPRADGGTVLLSAQLKNKQLEVVVQNPLPRQGEVSSKPGNRVALDNIRNRLSAYYGDKASFSSEEQELAFVTTIRYPAETAPDKPS